MFISRHYHNLEAKGRLAIPAVFREKLTSGGVITIGLDGCLFLFPNSYWQELCSKLASLPLTNRTGRQFPEVLVQSAVDLVSTHREDLNPELKNESASLKTSGDRRRPTRIEIWDRDRYHQHLNLVTQENPDWESGLKENI